MSKENYELIIAFQGMAGAYSNMACEAYFPNSKTLACNSFEDMLNSTKNEITDYSMVPVENSLAGRVADIHYLIPKYKLQIHAEHFQKVTHNLLGVKGATLHDIKTVRSHAQAISQCRKIILNYIR